MASTSAPMGSTQGAALPPSSNSTATHPIQAGTASSTTPAQPRDRTRSGSGPTFTLAVFAITSVGLLAVTIRARARASTLKELLREERDRQTDRMSWRSYDRAQPHRIRGGSPRHLRPQTARWGHGHEQELEPQLGDFFRTHSFPRTADSGESKSARSSPSLNTRKPAAQKLKRQPWVPMDGFPAEIPWATTSAKAGAALNDIRDQVESVEDRIAAAGTATGSPDGPVPQNNTSPAEPDTEGSVRSPTLSEPKTASAALPPNTDNLAATRGSLGSQVLAFAPSVAQQSAEHATADMPPPTMVAPIPASLIPSPHILAKEGVWLNMMHPDPDDARLRESFSATAANTSKMVRKLGEIRARNKIATLGQWDSLQPGHDVFQSERPDGAAPSFTSLRSPNRMPAALANARMPHSRRSTKFRQQQRDLLRERRKAKLEIMNDFKQLIKGSQGMSPLVSQGIDSHTGGTAHPSAATGLEKTAPSDEKRSHGVGDSSTSAAVQAAPETLTGSLTNDSEAEEMARVERALSAAESDPVADEQPQHQAEAGKGGTGGRPGGTVKAVKSTNNRNAKTSTTTDEDADDIILRVTSAGPENPYGERELISLFLAQEVDRARTRRSSWTSARIVSSGSTLKTSRDSSKLSPWFEHRWPRRHGSPRMLTLRELRDRMGLVNVWADEVHRRMGLSGRYPGSEDRP